MPAETAYGRLSRRCTTRAASGGGYEALTTGTTERPRFPAPDDGTLARAPKMNAASSSDDLFKTIVKTACGQRRKMMRNPLKPLALARGKADILSQDIFSQRPEQLSVEDFVALTNLLY